MADDTPSSRKRKKNEDVCEKKLIFMETEHRKSFNVSGTESLSEVISDDVERPKNQGRMFRDLGGMSELLEELTMEVVEPLRHPKVLSALVVTPVNGILLHGPSGCGKTILAEAIANEAGVPFHKISATEIVSGASEENIRELFSKAIQTAPSIVFIDEIDAISLKREDTLTDMGRRIATQLMACMEESSYSLQAVSSDSTPETSDQAFRHVLVIGATNHPDEIDPALRRCFDSEYYLGVPDYKARVHILSVLTRGLKLKGCSFDLLKIARLTPGYVGADLASLAKKAGILAVRRILKDLKNKILNELVDNVDLVEWMKLPWSCGELDNLSITMDDFEEAIKKVQPSSKRERFSIIPDVKWEDVGGLDDLRKEFSSHIVKPLMFLDRNEKFGIDFDTGFLLHGPPGCGKTILAKAVANEAGANFIHIKGPEILNKYVGESETAVRAIFNRARTCAPCILFFDEILFSRLFEYVVTVFEARFCPQADLVDALTTKRGKDSGWVVDSVENQLMTELDGGEKRSGVFVIGATNRLEAMDPAFLRPGRFGKHLYVGMPSPDQLAQILKAVCRNKPIDPDVNLDSLARSAACENFSGADLSALVHDASIAARDDAAATSLSTIRMRHFDEALATINTTYLKEKKRKKETIRQYLRVSGRI